MKHKGEFKPHEDASLEANFDVQKVHEENKPKNCGCGKDPCETYGRTEESYLQTKRMDKSEKTYHDTITKELEGTKAFKTLNPRFKKDIHKEVSKMILIANGLLTKEEK